MQNLNCEQQGGEGEGELKMRMKGEFAPGEFYMEKAPEPLVEEKQPEAEGFTF